MWPKSRSVFSFSLLTGSHIKSINTQTGIYQSLVTFLCFIFLLLFVNSSFAGSQLLVTPKRIVFTKNMRSAQVTIVNSGDEAATFRISLTNKRMNEEGRLEDVKEAGPGDLFADKLIRFSPRQVVLEPGKSQVVRLGLRKPADLQEGEYRSHMLFSAIPMDTGKDVAQTLDPKSGLRINLTAIVGISIPVIVRHGETEASVSITSTTFQPRQANEDQPHLIMELERSGTRSVYGDFLAEFVSNEGTRTVISQVGGFAVYTPGTRRQVKLPLRVPAGVELVNGVIQIFYRSPADQGGKVMAQAQIKIP